MKLTMLEVSKIIGCCYESVRYYIKKGDLIAENVGSTYEIDYDKNKKSIEALERRMLRKKTRRNI